MDERTVERVAREFCRLRGVTPDETHPASGLPRWTHELDPNEVRKTLLVVAAFDRVRRAENLDRARNRVDGRH